MQNDNSEENLNLLNLSEEILIKILKKVGPTSMPILFHVNNLFRRISLDEKIWKAIIKTHFSNDYAIAQYEIEKGNKEISWRAIYNYSTLRDYKHLTSTDIELRCSVKENNLFEVEKLSNVTLEILQKKDAFDMSALDYAGKLPNNTIAKHFFSQFIIPQFSNDDANWLYWISLCGLTISDTSKKFDIVDLFNERAGEILKNIVRTDNVRLLKEIPTNLLKSHLSTLLLDSAKYGAIKIIYFLLSPPHSMNVNYNWKYNTDTPLQLAVKCNQFNTVLFLLNKGAFINDAPKDESARAYYSQSPPLQIAIRENHLTLCKLLLNKGASTLFDLNDSAHERGVVKTAIKNKNPRMMKLLINTPGAVQDFCKHIQTMRETKEDLEIFHDFINYGVDLQATFANSTPLQFARMNPMFPATEIKHLTKDFENPTSFADGAINYTVWEEMKSEEIDHIDDLDFLPPRSNENH